MEINDKKIQIIKKFDYDKPNIFEKIIHYPLCIFKNEKYMIYVDSTPEFPIINFIDLSNFEIVYSINEIKCETISKILNYKDNLLIFDITCKVENRYRYNYFLKILKVEIDNNNNFSHEFLFSIESTHLEIYDISYIKNDKIAVSTRRGYFQIYDGNNNFNLINELYTTEESFEPWINYVYQLKCDENIFIINEVWGSYFKFYEKIDEKYNFKLKKFLKFESDKFSIFEINTKLYIGGNDDITIINLANYEIETIIQLKNTICRLTKVTQMINNNNQLIYIDSYGYIYEFNINSFEIFEYGLLSKAYVNNLISSKKNNYYISNLNNEIKIFQLNKNGIKENINIKPINNKKLIEFNQIQTISIENIIDELILINKDYVAVFSYKENNIHIYDTKNFQKISSIEKIFNKINVIESNLQNLLLISGSNDHGYSIKIYKISLDGKYEIIKEIIHEKTSVLKLISNERLLSITEFNIHIFDMKTFNKLKKIKNDEVDKLMIYIKQIKKCFKETEILALGTNGNSKLIFFDIEKEKVIKIINEVRFIKDSLYQINDGFLMTLGYNSEIVIINLNNFEIVCKLRNNSITNFYEILPIFDCQCLYAYCEYDYDDCVIIEVDIFNKNLNVFKPNIQNVEKQKVKGKIILTFSNQDENPLFIQKDDENMLVKIGESKEIKIFKIIKKFG